MKSSVPIGISSVVGFSLMLLGAIATAWLLAEGSHPAGLTPGDTAALSVAAGLATNYGRQLQAKAQIEAAPYGPQPVLLPTLIEEQASPPPPFAGVPVAPAAPAPAAPAGA